jgi:hypothetical protein
MEEIKINGVVDKDLKKILIEYNLYDLLLENKLLCAVCRKSICWETIGAVFLDNKSLSLICNEIQCLENFKNH